MKKNAMFLILFALFIIPSHALDLDTYGKFATGAWWMYKYEYYWDTIKTESDTTMGEDPAPAIISDFLTGGTLGIKAKGDKIGGCLELGIAKNLYDSELWTDKQELIAKFNYILGLKKWYMEFYFNDYLSLLCGRDIAPTCFLRSNQGFYGGNGFNNIGCLFTGSNPMFKLSVGPPEPKWKFQLAVVKIDTVNLRIDNNASDPLSSKQYHYKNEVKVPKIEGSFEFSLGEDFVGFEGEIVGGYQRFRQIGVTNSDVWNKVKKYKVNSFVVGGDFELRLGGFKMIVDLFGGYNIGIYGVYVGDVYGWWFEDEYTMILYPIIAGEIVHTSKIFEIANIYKYEPTDAILFEFGAGAVLGNHTFEEYKNMWHPTFAWYFLCGYTFFDMLQVTPEIGQYWYGPDDGFGRYTYWGLSTFIEF